MNFKALTLLVLLFFGSASFAQSPKSFQLRSPDGVINLSVVSGNSISWTVNHGATEIITPSAISITMANGAVLGKSPQFASVKTISVNNVINTPFYKKTRVEDNYNQLTIAFKGNYGLIFRAYNDGIAYRFFTTRKDSITIINEEANFNFKQDYKVFIPFVNDLRNNDKFTTSFEAHYNNIKLSALTKDSLAFLPVLADVGEGKKAVILEADLQDYPGMYLTAGEENGMQGKFAQYPTKEASGGFHNINYVVKSRAAYIAKTVGTRQFPWRVVIISDADKKLADNDMMQRLAEPSRIKDYSWIKAGKVAWDWWNDWNISNVDFKTGINVPTYKHYIDFAAANKLEYVVLDEGWSGEADLNDLKIDVQQLVDYAREKNVGIILWASWYALQKNNVDVVFGKFAKMGVKGFKIDFIDRDDQKMVSSLYMIAQQAADHQLILDFHGMYKPSGLQRTFPNVLNFEGVKGLENMKWGTTDQPIYDVTIPFIRMVSGPMDYTPGGMRNAGKDSYRAINSNPMTQGTRCHQMAMYTVFEAPLQMLADNPTIYRREQECTDYIADVPTIFDETKALDGKVGEYVSIARRKGTTWYMGAMTNWDARALTIDLSFLGQGTYRAIIFEDGINADKNATDYKKAVKAVSSTDKLTVQLAPGGGWAARFEKVD